ncbi:MerR family DNA-binding transcriptional regulator [Kribbella qitaiheensis]|uniref:MerR family DNA-binding transcriptional regulator n=1 Tax=Kribbella qitaiheensis TaxID=1544730 RepID=UPI001CA59B51
MLGTTPGFLRSLDEAKLITPQRSDGGHRRYSAISYAWPPAPANSSIKAQRSRPPAASSSWKTSSPKPSASTNSGSRTSARARLDDAHGPSSRLPAVSGRRTPRR